VKNYRYVVLYVFFTMSFRVFGNNEPGLIFIENKNQWPQLVDFALKVPGGQMFIQPGCFHYYLIDRQRLEERHNRTHTAHSEAARGAEPAEMINGYYIKVNFPGANLRSEPHPIGRLSTYYNYILGSDSAHWSAHANSYSGIYYPEFYNGIAMKLYSVGTNLKYDYIVRPNMDPSVIQVEYHGADRVELFDGNLVIKTSFGEITESRPYAYQFINGKKVTVRCAYVLHKNRLSFSFPDGYDPCHELTIDPLLVFSTYAGSTADSWGSTATPGERGCLYSSGVTQQYLTDGTFPATTGAFQRTSAGNYDIGILKYDSTGQHLLYATYLGGELDESPHSLVINSDEELLILGTVGSYHFPTTPTAFSRTFRGGRDVTHVIEYDDGSDIFVARLSKDGGTLLASTYLGGSSNDGLNDDAGGLVRNYGDQLRGDIITDAANNVYISSVTASADFPVTRGVDTTYNGGRTDAILVKLNAALSDILWGTFLGGSGTDASHTLKLDKSGNIFLAGGTNSVNFPVGTGGYRSSLAGSVDGWIAHIQRSGDLILNATFTGTADYDQVYFLDLNEAEEVFVYGQTASIGFPVTAGVYNNPRSGQFLQKFDTKLSSLKFSTVFGAGRRIPDISPTAFMVNDCGNIFMSGWGGLINSGEGFWQSDTRNMPVTTDAFQKTTSGSDFYFMVLSSDATQFLYGTYLGGTESRTHVDGGTSRFDKTGVVYHAVCSGCQYLNASRNPSSDFPTTPNAWSRVNRSQNCNNAAFKFDLAVLKAKARLPDGFDKICIPDDGYFENGSIGGRKFEWDFGDGTVLIKTDTAKVSHQYKNPGTYTVKLRAYNEGTCAVVDSTTLHLSVFNGQTVFPTDGVICAGDSYQLNVSGGVSYRWQSADGTFTSTSASPAVAPSATTTYLLFVTEASGCERKDTIEVDVVPAMDMNFDQKIISDCFERPSIELLNRTEAMGTDMVFFDFGDGQTSDADNVVHRYEKDDFYRVKIVGIRDICSFEKAVEVPIFTIKIPNVITPGSTGYNDRFIIEFGEMHGLIADDESNVPTPADYGIPVSIVVYNRWGDPVFTSHDYKNDWYGEGLASGVYYYEVTIQGYATCKNWIHVIR